MASVSLAPAQNSSDNNQLQCWCMTVDVPKELQEMARELGFDTQCICWGCVEEYERDREGFMRQQR